MNEDRDVHGGDIAAQVLDQWRRLWSEANRPAPNSQPERFLATTRALAAEPIILELADDESHRGLIVARRERMRIVRRIAYIPIRTPKLDTLVVVYGGILGNASLHTVMECLHEALKGEHRYDQIMLNKLAIDSELFAELLRRKDVVAQPTSLHWVQLLDDSFHGTMKRHSGKHRRRLGWEERKIWESFDGKIEWRTLTRVEDTEQVLEDAAQIGERTYHAGVGGLVDTSEVWRAQVRVAAEADQLRAHFLVGNGKPIAFVLGWNNHDSFHVVAMGYLPEHAKYSPGKHVLLRAIERACEDGMKWVDYGFGDAEYKRIYGTQNWQESTVHIYGKSLRARCAKYIDGAATRIDVALRRLVGTSIAASVKNRWRKFLNIGSS